MSDDGLRMVRLLRVLFDVLKNYDAAIENLSHVQERCNELEKERRVLSKALDLAVDDSDSEAITGFTTAQAREIYVQTAIKEIER